jgi:hypothetical protein
MFTYPSRIYYKRDGGVAFLLSFFFFFLSNFYSASTFTLKLQFWTGLIYSLFNYYLLKRFFHTHVEIISKHQINTIFFQHFIQIKYKNT